MPISDAPDRRAFPFIPGVVDRHGREAVLDGRLPASIGTARTRWTNGAGALLVLIAVAGCGGDKPSDPFGAVDADRIECRIGDATAFDRTCVVERTSGPDGLVLTIRHPDGGFRRLLVTKDGSGVAAADGAEPATVTVEGGDGVMVAIGGDNYRLPATVKPTAP